MPRCGLMDTTKLIEAEAALIQSRQNLRRGKRHLQKGLTTAGVVALYDAVFFGMHYYIAIDRRCVAFVENTDLWDAASLFYALTRAGVFDNPLIFNHFSLIAERALWQESFSFDANATLAEVEAMLGKLGVVPINRIALAGEVNHTH